MMTSNIDVEELNTGSPPSMTLHQYYTWYEAGYLDAINPESIQWLDPNSKGDVIELMGKRIGLPKRPDDVTEILNWDKPVADQKWQRIKVPKIGDWEDEDSYTPEMHSFVDRMFDYRENGLWIFINGKATYITGKHFFYLNWCKIDIGYPDYRDRDRRFFIIWEAAVLDDNCLGLIFLKHRREGATYKALALELECITSNYNSHGGIISKTGSDAKEAFEKLVVMYRGLPKFHRPIMSGNDDPKSELPFFTPAKRVTRKNIKLERSEALNSKISWRSTAENSYDSLKLKFHFMDETGKWEKADFQRAWAIQKQCLVTGRRVVGKAILPTTANKIDLKAGGLAFKEVWRQSNPLDLNKNGRTKSGLWYYFTPAFDGLEGFIDDYGMSMIEEARQYLIDERADLSGEDLSEHKRMYPFTWEEALRADTKQCHFDAEKIIEQLDWIESDPSAKAGIMIGDLTWKNGIQDSEVVFNPNPNGKFKFSYQLLESLRNNKKIKNGKQYPGNEALGLIGVDPYDHDTTTDNRRSNGAACAYIRYNINHPVWSETFIALYKNRPKKSEIFYEDMIKLAVFLGFPVLCENQKIGLIKHFERRGYGGYLMQRPESTSTEHTKNQKSAGLPNSTGVTTLYIEKIESFVVDKVGYDKNEDSYGPVLFEELLNDWLEFDIEHKTKFDVTVSSGFALIGADKVIKVERKSNSAQLIRKHPRRVLSQSS